MSKILPADVLAFVKTIESNVENGDGGADTKDTLTLCAIVREQSDLLETALVAADVAATALEVCAAENDSLRNSRTALEEQAWRISEERDALRERLAKLKTAIRESLAAWTLAIERDAIAAPDELIEPMNDLMQLVDPEVT